MPYHYLAGTFLLFSNKDSNLLFVRKQNQSRLYLHFSFRFGRFINKELLISSTKIRATLLDHGESGFTDLIEISRESQTDDHKVNKEWKRNFALIKFVVK
jgi:hypothetical protein